jgi:hypothetical protein
MSPPIMADLIDSNRDLAASIVIVTVGPSLWTWKISADQQIMKTSPSAGKPVGPRRNGVTRGILTD